MRLLAAAFAVTLLTLPALGQETIVGPGISPFGDLKYPADFDHFDYANPDAPKGGTMSFRGTAASGTFDSLNAFVLAGEPAQGLGRLYDTLLVPSADEAGAHYGLLAESLEYPPDRSWVIFTLRPQARFNDGTPVTPQDVVWTFDTLKAKGHPYYGIAFEGVEKAEALDGNRVRFRFKPGVPTRDLPAEVGQMEVLPQHFYDGKDFARSSMEFPLGSGAYVVAAADPGKQIRYCRAPDYWGADLAVNRGRNNFDCYVYEYFADSTAAFEALKVGNYLFHEEFSSAIWGSQYDFPALEKGWVIREEIPDGRPSGTQGFWFNLRREKFADVRVRQAISLLFNFEWSNESLFYGLYKRTDSFWENAAALQAQGLPQGLELEALEPFRDQLPPEVFTKEAYRQPVWSTRQLDRAAVLQASGLLDAAGWTVGADGLRRNAAGDVLAVTMLDDSAAFQRIIEPFLQNLRQVGIDAKLELVDFAQMQERQEVFDYDMTPARLPMSLSPSIELRTIFGSQGAAAKGTLNVAGVADPVVDGLIEAIVGAPTREVMEARVRALDRVLRAKQIWVPNWYRDTYWVAYWDVFGRPAVQPPYQRNEDFWWIEQDKLDALRAQGALR
jgi:microcin C transport system substrate-binding protein